jgi:TolB-like protein
MGEVYLADDMKLDGAVALKRLNPQLHSDIEYRRDLETEAQRAFELHAAANVASLFNIFDSGDETFLVMEYVEGVSLRERMRAPLTIDEFLDIAIQCCVGLEAAHQRRILHRDIKPANIMLTPKGTVKICDFGLARRLPATPDAKAMNSGASITDDATTTAFSIAGTPAYMAPEVFAAMQPDERADIFSLGVVFYELLARLSPFAGDTYREIRNNILQKEPAPLGAFNSHVKPRLERIISRMLSRHPSERYSAMTEVKFELKGYQKARATGGVRLVAMTVALATLLVLGGVWVGSEPPTIARGTLVVLPFVYSDDQPLADGLAIRLNDQLRINLAGSSLDVISADAVRRSGIETAEEARNEFEADLVLSGTLSILAGTEVVAYELHDAVTGDSLQAEDVEDAFNELDALSGRVLNAVMDVAEGDPQLGRSTVIFPETSVGRAEDAYTRGIS